MSEWKSGARIRCECNCGIEVQLGALPKDAVSTQRGSAETSVEINDRMQPGHISLPNGLGLDFPDASGKRVATGVSPNELTRSEDRDWLAGTPWHKHTPARVEAL